MHKTVMEIAMTGYYYFKCNKLNHEFTLEDAPYYVCIPDAWDAIAWQVCYI